MKLIKSRKKEFQLDKIVGIVCWAIYTLCLLYIRFLDCWKNCISNKMLFVAISMFAVIVIVFLNYTMCKSGTPSKELYNKIDNFEIATQNKNEIKRQRDILLKNYETIKYTGKWKKRFFIIEILACILVFVLFIIDIESANLITGIIVDIETSIMVFIFYLDTHYKFKIERNLNL